MVNWICWNDGMFSSGQFCDPKCRPDYRSGKQIVVNDNGPGIPEAEMGKLFEPFTRLSTSANLSGSGLGLSISRNLAHAHGGELFVSNAADGGLSVTILLPHN